MAKADKAMKIAPGEIAEDIGAPEKEGRLCRPCVSWAKVDRRAHFSALGRLARVVIAGLPRQVAQRGKGGAPTPLSDAAFLAALKAAAQRRPRPPPRRPKPKERSSAEGARYRRCRRKREVLTRSRNERSALVIIRRAAEFRPLRSAIF